MLRKKAKNISAMAVTVLFVLSIGYFAVLPPTSAWFYQKYDGVEHTFIFGTLDVNQDFDVPVTLDLPAATKLEDPGETLFDESLHIETITAQNTGSFPARVYLKIAAKTGNLNGFHYFFYYDKDAEAGDTVKDIIAGKITISDNNATYTALNLYNVGNGVNNNYGRFIVIQPHTTETLKIAFWTDYTVVGDSLKITDNVTVHYNYDVNITLSAGQNTDGWFTR